MDFLIYLPTYLELLFNNKNEGFSREQGYFYLEYVKFLRVKKLAYKMFKEKEREKKNTEG